MRMRTGLLATMASALLLAGCQAAGPLPGAPGTRLTRQAAGSAASTPSLNRQLPRQELQSFAQPLPVTVEPNRLIFEGTQHAIQPNQILMGRSLKDQDFLRRVRQVQPVGGRLIVETVPATLFEAFQELDVAGVRSVRAPERISMQAHRFTIGGVVDVVLDLGLRPDFSDAQLKVKDSRLFVRLAPRFELDAKVRTEYRFLPAQAGDGPLKPVGSVSFEAVKVPAWIGPVPLMFHLRPGAGLDFGHRAEGKLINSFDVNGEFKAVIELEAALGETPSIQSSSDYRIDGRMQPPELRLTGSAKARLHLPTVHLDSEIAGLVGPFVMAGPYVDGSFLRRLTVTPQQTTVFSSVSAQLGLAIDGGITPTRLFGKQLSREIRIKILDKRIKELYRKEGSEVLNP